MALLGTPLAFALGGEALAPFVVNLEPSPDDPEVSSADPIRFSVRDAETFVVAGQLQVSVGYAHTRADGISPYEEDIAGVFLSSVLAGFVDDDKATISEVIDGIELVKNVVGPQRSVYAVGSPLVPGEQAFLATAEIRPDLISVDAQGAVFGVEHGFRNTAAYLFFTNPSGVSSIRITGPKNSDGVRSPDVEITFDWTSAIRRYLILWNEIKSQVEFYVEDAGTTQRIHTEPIPSFQEFDTSPLGSPTPQRGAGADATMLWGIEGPIGDRATFANVALATDVGFPIIGLSRPGNFTTLRSSDELVRFEKKGDPRLFSLSPWFGPDELIFSDVDTDGVAKVESSEEFSLTKVTYGKTFAVYREEPGFLSANIDGLMFEVRLAVTPGDVVEARAVGMGFMLYDGQTVWQFDLFGGAVRTIGLLKAGGSPSSASGHVLPVSAVDWLSGPVTIRVTIDPRRGLIEMFNMDGSHTTPILSTPFVRGNYPDAAEVGLVAVPSFFAFGHLNTLNTTGTLEVQDLRYSTLYQSYDAWDGIFPDGANPAWSRVGDGFNQISPLSGLSLLGGGFGPTPLGYFVAGGGAPTGTQALDNNQLVLDNPAGLLQVYKRGANWDSQRGAVFETRMQVTDHKPQSRTGLFMILDDGLNAFMLSFVDTPTGKFVAVPVRAGLSSFVEHVGTTGEAAQLSFKLDWSQSHTYRMEYRRLDGLYIFIDNDPNPKLVIPNSANVDYPSSQFLAPTVAFGQLSKEGSVSRWDFARAMFSRGYEVSFKKADPDAVLEDDIGNTQAIVLAFAEDND